MRCYRDRVALRTFLPRARQGYPEIYLGAIKG